MEFQILTCMSLSQGLGCAAMKLDYFIEYEIRSIKSNNRLFLVYDCKVCVTCNNLLSRLALCKIETMASRHRLPADYL